MKLFNIFSHLIENFSVGGVIKRRNGACELRPQVLRVALIIIGPLAVKEGTSYF